MRADKKCSGDTNRPRTPDEETDNYMEALRRPVSNFLIAISCIEVAPISYLSSVVGTFSPRYRRSVNSKPLVVPTSSCGAILG